MQNANHACMNETFVLKPIWRIRQTDEMRSHFGGDSELLLKSVREDQVDNASKS